MVLDPTGLKVHVKFGESRSNRSRDIRLPTSPTPMYTKPRGCKSATRDLSTLRAFVERPDHYCGDDLVSIIMNYSVLKLGHYVHWYIATCNVHVVQNAFAVGVKFGCQLTLKPINSSCCFICCRLAVISRGVLRSPILGVRVVLAGWDLH